MKKLFLISFVFLLVTVFGFSACKPSGSQVVSDDLVLEITQKGKSSVLHLPVSADKRLQATIPIENGGEVAAVRLTPVIQNRGVSVEIAYLSKTGEGEDAKFDVIAGKGETYRVISEGETALIKDDNGSWEVRVKAVSASGANLSSEVSAKMRDYGCATCNDTIVCPRNAKCIEIENDCGSICCIQGCR